MKISLELSANQRGKPFINTMLCYRCESDYYEEQKAEPHRQGFGFLVGFSLIMET
ncbi:hypothetical protein [Vibrio campbellii]|uniref:hypothetical protein n=1 Tax=Vibrio campbellii TaxID=680 RepID=UPI0012D3D08B|nr:hypothetical protein [Vibrio campbellii]